MVSWLNANSGAVMALLTLAYVVYTHAMVREMRKSNKQSQEQERGRNRPFIVFYVESRDRCFYAVIRNFGSQPAFNVRTTVDPAISRAHEGQPGISFVDNLIPMLVPGVQIDDSLGATPIYLQKERNTSHKVTVSYADSLGNNYYEQAPVSFEHYRNRMTSYVETAQDKMARSLDSAERTLDKLALSVSQLTWVINNEFNRPSKSEKDSSIQDDHLRGFELNAEELEYLSNIADAPHDGYVPCFLISTDYGEDNEKYSKMMDKFLILGIARKELDRFVLTDRAYNLIRCTNHTSCQLLGDSSEGRGGTVGPCPAAQ